MTGSFWTDWSILTVSLFNTILLFWLGLTVLLNAEKRSWGIWLAGGALLLGGGFFLSHTAIAGYSPTLQLDSLQRWWQVGWIPVTCLPFAWYSVILWYSGYWEPASTLQPRHKPWFVLSLLLAAGFILLLTFAHPLPSAAQLLDYNIRATPSVFDIPLLVLVYPFYTMLCTGLTLDVLRWPGPSRRMMAEQARQRAWPWLGAASLTLFVVSLLVGGTVFWIVASTRSLRMQRGIPLAVGWLDLLIASLIAVAILLVGQAIITYEVFTGTALPRRGLQRFWHRAIYLAAGYSLVVPSTLLLDLGPVSVVLLSTMILAFFYALLSWRAFEERERMMANLRPFLTSQNLYEELVSPNPASIRAGRKNEAFHTLCANLLECELAYLVPLGPLAALAGPPLAYPNPPKADSTLGLDLLYDRLIAPEVDTAWIELDPKLHGGAGFALPLQGSSGIVGALLLGKKTNEGVYTHEEIEIARLAGERLIDAQASAVLAQRLMALQRQRLAESRVMDRRARQALHDDILPRLHAVILNLGRLDDQPQAAEAVTALSNLHEAVANLMRELPPAAPEVADLGLEGALQRLVQVEFKEDFNRSSWEINSIASQGIKSLSPFAAEVAFMAVREAIRNAARHGRGRESGRELNISLQVEWLNGLLVRIQDDGVGTASQVQPDQKSGSGQGLTLHSTLLAVLGGSLEVQSVPDRGTEVRVFLPVEHGN